MRVCVRECPGVRECTEESCDRALVAEGILVLHCLVRRRVRPTLSRFFAEDSCSVAIGGACIFDQSCRASYRPCLFGCSELAFFVARLRLLCRRRVRGAPWYDLEAPEVRAVPRDSREAVPVDLEAIPFRPRDWESSLRGGCGGAYECDPVRAELRRAYLLAALRLHPDKGGSNAAFLGMQAAYQLLDGATSTARQGATRELRDAAIAAARARRDTTDSATQRALRLSREVTQAREEARKRAEAEWVPPWRTAAQHIRTASGAFMDLWTE